MAIISQRLQGLPNKTYNEGAPGINFALDLSSLLKVPLFGHFNLSIIQNYKR